MPIIRLPNRTATSLGTTYLVDDPLIEKPEPTSELVGRAQGIYAFASQRDYGLLWQCRLSEVAKFSDFLVVMLWQRQFGLK
ncbi:hypothetical protein Goshw_020346 [Gossypium schwendimanii]|uniref:Dirigent protein n=1 Tax=Gossypium schwendimanii TaxID=34291 RepID=A0A7J9N788_GOSSC|nr:hypothetical protein [Gossypium schwendimanii]